MNQQFDALISYVEKLQDFDDKVLKTDIVSEKKDEVSSPIFDKYKDNLESITNFNSFEFEDLFHDFEPHYSSREKPGPKRTISSLDAFLILLIFYKTGLDFCSLSGLLKLNNCKVQRAINNSRPALNQMISLRWDSKKFHHKPDQMKILPEVALIVDSTTIEINRPGSYSEAKPYFDEKN